MREPTRASSPWPEGFKRVLDEEWTREPLEALALKYDTVQNHGWYRNLDRTVADLAAHLGPGDILLDYSGGTGILASRLLEEVPERSFGMLVVDSSPKFLRVSLEKLGGQERVAFRLIRYLKDERRLQRLDEVLDRSLLERGVAAIVSTNAIHLYYGLEDTVASWHALLRPQGRLFVQSGNIGHSSLPSGAWIIDDTVEAIHQAAVDIVRANDAYSQYRPSLENHDRLAAYEALRRRFFLPVRPLEHYLSVLQTAGFRIHEVVHLPIEARVDQWYEFLSTYHEGVLGWIGGSARVEGVTPPDSAVQDRLRVLGESMTRVFCGRPTFEAVWTYINAQRTG